MPEIDEPMLMVIMTAFLNCAIIACGRAQCEWEVLDNNCLMLHTTDNVILAHKTGVPHHLPFHHGKRAFGVAGFFARKDGIRKHGHGC